MKRELVEFLPVGPNLYWEVGERILEKNLEITDGSDVASLLHYVYCDPCFNDQPNKYREAFESKGGVYVFNRNIWTQQGVYVIQDSEVDALQQLRGNSEKVKVWDLMQLIEQVNNGINGVRFSKDGKVRFAPKESYSLGEVNTQSILDDCFVIANFGEQGAKNLSEVAAHFNNKPFLHLMDVDEEFYGFFSPLDCRNKVVSVSTENDRLNIYGVRSDGYDGRGDVKSFGFGML